MGDDTSVLEYVLSCDVVRKELLQKETALNESKKDESLSPEKQQSIDTQLTNLYEQMRQLDVLNVEHRAVV